MSSPSSPERTQLPPPASLAVHLDLVGGIAGDMFVAALADAFPALVGRVESELAAVRPDGAAIPRFLNAASGGLRARRFGLATSEGNDYRRAGADGRRSAPGRRRQDGHAGTAYVELRRRVAESTLAPATRDHALALLALLAQAEADVHGVAVTDVHFHELADWDSLLDVVAAGAIAAALDGARWTATAPPLGGGTVRTDHGLLPVPAPATTALLTGYPWRDDGIGGERVTPTGAAILRHLVPAAACDGPREGGRLLAVGCGAGARALRGAPNVLRALVFERAAETGGDAVTVLEFDVDDMSGEEIAVAAERLRAERGVVDVTFGARMGKKGRPASDFRVLAAPESAESVARACFVETSTLGLRMRDERRRTLSRSELATSVDGGPLQVKLALRPDGRRTAKAAQDDVASTRGLAARRRARAAGEQRALGGEKE